jgi:hypothetical protein
LVTATKRDLRIMFCGAPRMGATMTTTRVDITAAPRAVLRESVRLLYRVLGEERLSTARANAWEAVCDDRRRAEERERVTRLLAAARNRTVSTTSHR